MCFFGKSRENRGKDRNFFQVLSGDCSPGFAVLCVSAIKRSHPMPAGDGSRQTPDDWVIIGA